LLILPYAKGRILNKVALITGITGQDGSYLAEFLLGKNYQVHGLRRRSSSFNTGRIDHLYADPHRHQNLTLHYGDLSDASSLEAVIRAVRPDEIYNLGAQSHVAVSFVQPAYTFDINTLGVVRLLEAIRSTSGLEKSRLYQASTSEMFGSSPAPQNENTVFCPQSPYAVSKLAAHELIRNYREAYGRYFASGILFNHESPRRGETFVTRKITLGLSRIKLGINSKLYLGNLNAIRDWGHAREYVELQWLMLQQPEPRDLVIGTGKSSSVRDFCTMVAANLDIALIFEGSGVNEKGIDSKTGKTIIEVDPMYFRASEVENLQADITQATKILGWNPKITLEKLVEEMTSSDFLLVRKEYAAGQVH